jgi:signal transduction protein with GAF and PtsI domain
VDPTLDEKEMLVMVTLGHLAVEHDNHAYLERVTELCARATDADRCSVFLVDVQKGELRSAVAQRIAAEIRLPIGQGLAGHAAATGETINVPDAYADPRFHQEVDRATGYHTSNTLTVPVWTTDRQTVVGVIQVLNKMGGAFERHDQILLERIADAIGPVLERMVYPRGVAR